jgi:hypothetical protein
LLIDAMRNVHPFIKGEAGKPVGTPKGLDAIIASAQAASADLINRIHEQQVSQVQIAWPNLTVSVSPTRNIGANGGGIGGPGLIRAKPSEALALLTYSFAKFVKESFETVPNVSNPDDGK